MMKLEYKERMPLEDKIEEEVLGGLMRNPSVADEAALVVRSTDFRKDAHRITYRAIIAMRSTGAKTDLVTVADQIVKMGHLDNVGGYAWLAEIFDNSTAPHMVLAHAHLVRENAICRELESAGLQIAREANERHGTAGQILEAAEQRIMALSQLGAGSQAKPFSAALGEAFDAIDAWSGGTARGLPTGFIALDEITAGLHPTELTILAARPSGGKTALALALLRHLSVDHGVPCFFASIEQADRELGERVLCAEAGIDSQELRQGRLNQEIIWRLKQARDKLLTAKLWTDDCPSQSILRITATARRLHSKHKIGLVVIDYLQLIEPENRRDMRHEQVTAVTQRLKGLARELKIPVVALAQVSRAVDSSGRERRPRLSDLRESGGIEQSADCVWMLYPINENMEGPEQEVGLVVAKNRNGPRGEIGLTFQRKYARFVSPTSPFEGNK